MNEEAYQRRASSPPKESERKKPKKKYWLGLLLTRLAVKLNHCGGDVPHLNPVYVIKPVQLSKKIYRKLLS